MIILNNQQIQYKLTRISYQIFEENIDEECINIIGIKNGGYILAKKICDILLTIFNKKTNLNFIEIDKKTFEIKNYDFIIEKLENKNIIIIDDVLNTGKTIAYVISYILKMNLNSLKVAILIDRSYKKFPIKCDYKGMSIYTSFFDTIDVVFENNGEINAFLN